MFSKKKRNNQTDDHNNHSSMASNGGKNVTVMGLRDGYDERNPFAVGRKDFDDRYERLAKNASSWKKVAFFMLLLLAVSTSVVIFMAQEVKVIPFVVQVDEHGYEIAVSAVAPSGITDDRIIMARLGDFITNIRSKYSDRPATMSLVLKAYDTIEKGSEGQRKLDSYFMENNPLTNDNLVTVNLQSVLRATPESNKLWRAEWSEKVFEKGVTTPISDKYYTGTFEVYVVSPTSIQDIMRNPLGIFIRDMNINERLSNEKPLTGTTEVADTRMFPRREITSEDLMSIPDAILNLK